MDGVECCRNVEHFAIVDRVRGGAHGRRGAIEVN